MKIMQKVFVILYHPGYGDDSYTKGVFSSRKRAREAMKSDNLYRHSKEGIDFDIEEYQLDNLD